MTVVDVNEFTKKYGDRIAVDNVTVHLEEATWCVVVGPNGSGKTTLLGALAGLVEPTDGTVTVGGAAAGTPLARAEVAYFSDSPAFYSDLTVAEHIDYVAGIYQDTDVVDRAVSIIEAFGLASRADELPDTFSRGMKQKAALALTLARPASVLLLDEPTRGLDVNGASTLIELLKEIHAGGATVITVTHEPERFADVPGLRLEAHEGEFRQERSR